MRRSSYPSNPVRLPATGGLAGLCPEGARPGSGGGRLEPHTGLGPSSSGFSAVSTFPFQRLPFSSPRLSLFFVAVLFFHSRSLWPARPFLSYHLPIIWNLLDPPPPAFVMMGTCGIVLDLARPFHNGDLPRMPFRNKY